MATLRTPVKVIVDANTQVQGLGEYTVGEVVGVVDGGTGSESFAAGKILVGNGANKLLEEDRSSITAGNSSIQVLGGSSATIGNSNVVVSVVESELNISNMQGTISLSQIEAQITPGFTTTVFHVDGGVY